MINTDFINKLHQLPNDVVDLTAKLRIESAIAQIDTYATSLAESSQKPHLLANIEAELLKIDKDCISGQINDVQKVYARFVFRSFLSLDDEEKNGWLQNPQLKILILSAIQFEDQNSIRKRNT